MDDELMEAISRHIEKHIGPVASVLHELIPEEPHIDVHVVAPREGRPYYTLVTSGMSEEPMSLPEEVEGQLTPYIELMLCLPQDWRVDQLNDPQWNWPITWLRFLAKYPHQHGTWLYVSHTVPNGEDCEPFAPGTGLCCWFVRIPQTVTAGFYEFKHGERDIGILGLTPIHRSEMDFALSRDVDSLYALDQALAAAGVTELIDPKRAPLTLQAMRSHLGRSPGRSW